MEELRRKVKTGALNVILTNEDDEEIGRLQSHISSMTDVLESDESIGRKLDFMAQEMNREANTILSKSSDVDLADHAIELKTNVEKVREQIQNIE